MTHEIIAACGFGAQSKDNVMWGNRPRRRMVGHIVKLIRRHQSGYGLEVGDGDQDKAFRLEHPHELTKRGGHLMRKKMFNIMAGPHRIHGTGGNGPHIGQRRDNIGMHIGIEIQSNFLPCLVFEMRVKSQLIDRTAPDMQNDFFIFRHLKFSGILLNIVNAALHLPHRVRSITGLEVGDTIIQNRRLGTLVLN
ncbi:MAG TPA: hypothetical protein VGK14_09165 [Novimethylophilus sp.]